jgi:hypothetical protein
MLNLNSTGCIISVESIYIRRELIMSKVIKDWNDLVGLESEDYILDIDTVI